MALNTVCLLMTLKFIPVLPFPLVATHNKIACMTLDGIIKLVALIKSVKTKFLILPL